MNLEIGAVGARATTASVMAKDIAEHVSALMLFCGIESISYERFAAGFGSKLHVSIAPFADAPKQVKEVGIIVKDDLARIMAVANINRIVAKPTETERLEIREAWANAVNDADTANGGSGQDADDDDSGEDK